MEGDKPGKTRRLQMRSPWKWARAKEHETLGDLDSGDRHALV